MVSLRTHKPEMPAHFCHLIFQLYVVCLASRGSSASPVYNRFHFLSEQLLESAKTILPHCVSLYFKLRFVPKGPNLASVIEKKEILLIRMLELFNRLNLTSLMF